MLALRWLIVFAIVFSVSRIEAEPSEQMAVSVSDPATELVAVLQKLDSMSGLFIQTIIDGDGAELQTTSGDFQIKRPGYFLWHVKPPYEQIVLGTPDALKVYDPDLEQMTVYKNDAVLGSPAALISGDLDTIARDYDVSLVRSSEQNIYTLTRLQSGKGSFAGLDLIFSNTTSALAGMRFTDQLGQSTNIQLSDTKRNISIDDGVFRFEPPAGTDIIVDG